MLRLLGEDWAVDLVTSSLADLAEYLVGIGMQVQETAEISKHRLPSRGGCINAVRSVVDPAGGQFKIMSRLAVLGDTSGARLAKCELKLSAIKTHGGTTLSYSLLGLSSIEGDTVDRQGVQDALHDAVKALFPWGDSRTAIPAAAHDFGRALLEEMTP